MNAVEKNVIRNAMLTLRAGGDYAECADAHYRALDVDSLVSPMKGDLHAFVDFLSAKWGWKIEHDTAGRTIVADENKITCVCPLVNAGLINDPALCDCSCAFAARMFGAVVGREVRAAIVRSILRGAESCVYEIRY